LRCTAPDAHELSGPTALADRAERRVGSGAGVEGRDESHDPCCDLACAAAALQECGDCGPLLGMVAAQQGAELGVAVDLEHRFHARPHSSGKALHAVGERLTRDPAIPPVPEDGL
jgi:hypothetical protein